MGGRYEYQNLQPLFWYKKLENQDRTTGKFYIFRGESFMFDHDGTIKQKGVPTENGTANYCCYC